MFKQVFTRWIHLLIALLVPTAAMAKVGDTIIFNGSEDYHLYYENRTNEQIVVFTGWLLPDSNYEGLHRLYEILEKNKETVVFFIDYRGGYKPAAKKFAKELRKACPTGQCRLQAYVHETCASMCPRSLHYFDKVIAHSKASFGFHRIWVGIPGFVKLTTEDEEEFAAAHLKAGMKADWLNLNLKFLVSNQAHCAFLSSSRAVESGLIDSIDDDFGAKYFSTKPAFLRAPIDPKLTRESFME